MKIVAKCGDIQSYICMWRYKFVCGDIRLYVAIYVCVWRCTFVSVVCPLCHYSIGYLLESPFILYIPVFSIYSRCSVCLVFFFSFQQPVSRMNDAVRIKGDVSHVSKEIYCRLIMLGNEFSYFTSSSFTRILNRLLSFKTW